MAYNWAKGTDGKATLGGTTLSLTGWTMSETGDNADTTHSGSSGLKLTLDITKEVTGSIEGMYDLDAPFTSTVYRGVTGTLLLYVEAAGYMSVPARILDFEVTSKVNDVIRFSATYVATAAVTYAS